MNLVPHVIPRLIDKTVPFATIAVSVKAEAGLVNFITYCAASYQPTICSIATGMKAPLSALFHLTCSRLPVNSWYLSTEKGELGWMLMPSLPLACAIILTFESNSTASPSISFKTCAARKPSTSCVDPPPPSV